MMNYLKIIVLVISIPIITAATLHKFYVSTTKVAYVKEEKSIQVITKLFIDDLENVLRERYNAPISLATTKETKAAEALLKKYILQKLKMEVDDEEVQLNYIGREYEIDIVKIYLEVTNVVEFKTLSIENKVLFEISPEQQNIIHVKSHGKKKSLLLDKDNPKGLLNFE